MGREEVAVLLAAGTEGNLNECVNIIIRTGQFVCGGSTGFGHLWVLEKDEMFVH